MKRTDVGTSCCPVARSLSHVGEWWSILILRDAMIGLTRFDEFEKSLGIAPNMLTRRLASLVEAGLLERVQYQDRPPRYEYFLTEAGKAFRPVLLAFVEWGSRYFAPEGRSVQLVERATGRPVRVGMVDLDTGKPVDARDYVIEPGPAADDHLRYCFTYGKTKRRGGDTGLKFAPPSISVVDDDGDGRARRGKART